MKKQLLLGIMLLGIFVTSKAQKPDTARLLIHYKFTWVMDTGNRAKPYSENMVLHVGKSAGAYRSYDRIAANAQFKKAYAEAVAASPDGQVRVNRMGVGTPVEYYQYPNEKKLLTNDRLVINSYLIENPMPVIDWKISGDTATFGDLHCQKATCNFKGRDYTAWFCPDLPVHTGPWKLNGLPGVIVDAYDAKNEVVFKFDGIEKAGPVMAKDPSAVAENDLPPILRGLNNDPNLIAPPASLIKATQKEFDKLKENMKKNPDAFGQAMVAGNRAAGEKTDAIAVRKGPALNGPVINNPIELPATK